MAVLNKKSLKVVTTTIKGAIVCKTITDMVKDMHDLTVYLNTTNPEDDIIPVNNPKLEKAKYGTYGFGLGLKYGLSAASGVMLVDIGEEIAKKYLLTDNNTNVKTSKPETKVKSKK